MKWGSARCRGNADENSVFYALGSDSPHLELSPVYLLFTLLLRLLFR